MNPLVPCPACDRHVRASETACPFCDSALPTDLASRAVPPANRRLSRAAAFTFAASLAVTSGALSSACGGVVDGSGNGDPGGVQTMYGIAVVEDSGSPIDDGGVAAMYGLAYFDGGVTEDAGHHHHSHDAGPPDDGGIAAMYGIAFPPDAGEPGPPDDGGVVAAYGLPSH